MSHHTNSYRITQIRVTSQEQNQFCFLQCAVTSCFMSQTYIDSLRQPNFPQSNCHMHEYRYTVGALAFACIPIYSVTCNAGTWVGSLCVSRNSWSRLSGYVEIQHLQASNDYSFLEMFVYSLLCYSLGDIYTIWIVTTEILGTWQLLKYSNCCSLLPHVVLTLFKKHLMTFWLHNYIFKLL